jgi:pimeloyl-ACP methyl ester carboxylesterase
MSAPASAPSSTRIGLVLAGSIAVGVLFGLLLVLVAFAGGAESRITGSALVALGTGFALFAVASGRTSQPQRWARPPGVATITVGLGLIALGPDDRLLGLTGWVWPVLLLALVGWSVANARRSLRHWSRRAVLYPALLVLLLIAVAGAFETVAEATSTTAPATGRTYLVDGHRLYLSCTGRGGPTVVLLNGLGERTPSWASVERTLSASTRVCVFDRAGQGFSGAGPGAQDGHQLALDLHELLRTAGIDGPYVLAGHSVGGAYALVYAAMYPSQVAGLALIDSSSPNQFDLPGYPRFYSTWHRVGALLPSLSRVGGHVFGLSTPREYSADRVEFDALRRVFDQAKALRNLHGKPLAVVTADRGAMRGWQPAQAKLARLSTNSFRVHVPGATHATILEAENYARVASRAIVEVSERAA